MMRSQNVFRPDRVERFGRCVLFLVAALPAIAGAGPLVAQEISAASQTTAVTEADLQHLAGHWYVSKKEPTTYYYRDAERWVDLFSYHTLDSNKDGIPNLRLSHDENHLIVQSQGYPNHPTAVFPNSGNPNSIRVQDFTFRFPLVPRKAEAVTRLPMGPIGMTLNGVVFFNPFEMAGQNAVEGYDEVWLDSCCGHPQQTGVYHYHKYPTCVKSPFVDSGKGHSPIIGFAFDGFPVYGPFESDGQRAMELTGERALDACNGHDDPVRGYHYHVTPNRFPYILGGYAGVIEASNNRQLRRPSSGVIEDTTQPGDRFGEFLPSIRPDRLQPGRTHSIQLELNVSASRRPIPEGVPSWVQFGPYEATKIERDGNTISVQVQIPDDADLGSFLDCHLEFGSGQRPVVFKKNNAVRIIAP
ncbi:MAG: YHYH protein [Planctomycetota bacterium]